MKSLAGHQAVLVGVAVFVGGLVAGPSVAQSVTPGIKTAKECLAAHLGVADDLARIESLTRAERIAKLDKILLESLHLSGLCQSLGSATGGGGVGGAAGGVAGGVAGGAADGGGVQGSADSAGKDVVESTPASDIQGDTSDPGKSGDERGADDSTTTDVAKSGTDANVLGGTGSEDGDLDDIPPDIPSAGSDDIIAKQFRQAAVEETDPEAQAKLWNEYRRYKGLPVKEAPEPNAPDAKP